MESPAPSTNAEVADAERLLDEHNLAFKRMIKMAIRDIRLLMAGSCILGIVAIAIHRLASQYNTELTAYALIVATVVSTWGLVTTVRSGIRFREFPIGCAFAPLFLMLSLIYGVTLLGFFWPA